MIRKFIKKLLAQIVLEIVKEDRKKNTFDIVKHIEQSLAKDLEDYELNRQNR